MAELEEFGREHIENALENYTEDDIVGLKRYTYENRIKPFITQANSDDWDAPSSNGVPETSTKDESWGD